MTETTNHTESLVPPDSFADRLLKFDPYETRSILRPLYPAIDLPGNPMMIGDPKESLKSCPRAFHVTNTSILEAPIDIRPLSYHQMNFERVTGKVMTVVLDAFNAAKFTERSVNDPYPIPASSEVNGAVFLGNNVSSELMRLSREATIVRPENAKEVAFALTLLSWQTHRHLPEQQRSLVRSAHVNKTINSNLDLHEYAQDILHPISSDTIQKMVQLLSKDHESFEATEWALQKIGITGFWAKGIYEMMHHSEQYPEHFRPSVRTVEELIRLAEQIPEYIAKRPAEQLRVPIIAEADPRLAIPSVILNSKQVPFVFYTPSRPDSILTLPTLKGGSITKFWVDPLDFDTFSNYVWLRGLERLSDMGTQIRVPREKYIGKQPILEYFDFNVHEKPIPIYIQEEGDIPTTDFCISRYPDEQALFNNFLKGLEKGDRLFITQDTYNTRLSALRKYSQAIGLSLNPLQEKLIQNSLNRIK